MIQTRAGLLSACALSVAMLGGCSTFQPSDDPIAALTDESVDFEAQTFRYTVARGELLGNIALRETGDLGTWPAIAQYNGIEDPRTLREGAVLVIPMNLVRGFDPSRPEASFVEARAALDAASSSGSPIDDSLPVLRIESPDNDRAVDSVGDSTDEPARPVADSVEQPIAISDPTAEAAPDTPVEVVPVARREPIDAVPTGLDDVRTIRIVGSYYPKGIYSEPSTASDLLMRVAPGSEFVLERSLEGWYRVSIEAGTGYIRAGDARIVDGAS